jgi:nucleoside-diphosphate-sugar epimerase
MEANARIVGVIGATSLVGQVLLSKFVSGGYKVKAFTRSDSVKEVGDEVEWRQLITSESDLCSHPIDVGIAQWVCVAPIWCLPSHFSLLKAYGVRRIVALSSTSMITKSDSIDKQEKEKASMLADAEEELRIWAEQNGVEWLIIRPTLIYGLGQDKNVSEIAQLIRRFGFFPLVGKAFGLRQPIHACDVAHVCMAALLNSGITNRSYNISGGETLTYKEMVVRVFAALGRPVRVLTVPLWMFRVSILLLRLFPRYRHWTVSMALRMNQDLLFDSQDAERDLSYRPRSFILSKKDILRGATH